MVDGIAMELLLTIFFLENVGYLVHIITRMMYFGGISVPRSETVGTAVMIFVALVTQTID